MSDAETRIEEALADFLDAMLAGQSSDAVRERLLAGNPDLQPELAKRLDFAASVYRAVGAKQAGDSKQPDDELSLTLPSPMQRINRVECPHCGNKLNLVSREQAEITCANCGSVVTVDDAATATAPMTSMPERIGRFEVQTFLGAGGFGTAYRAMDTALDRLVAVKVPRAGQFLNSQDRERFIREAQNAAKLRHSNIVQVYEINADGELPYIVSEYIEGVTLSDRLSGQRMPAKEVARIMAIVAEAVHHAHANGIIHRDLKPSNVFLNLNNTPFVADFGLARNLEAEYTMTLQGEVLGTPAYMSPEQAQGDQKRVTARSDVYSLGVMLYRMLCCEHPFRGSARMMLHQVMHEQPRPPRRIDQRIPVDLETITLKALDKDPSKRYASARELAEDLQRWLTDRPIVVRPESQASKLRRWIRHNPRTTALLTVVSLLLITISIMSAFWAVREHGLQQIANRFAADAQRNERESKRLLTASFTRNGLRELDFGLHADAALWFTEALVSSVDRPAVHRTRIGMTLNGHPKLTMVKSAEAPITVATFTANGRDVLVGNKSGLLSRMATDATVARMVRMKHSAMVVDASISNPKGRIISFAREQKSASLWNATDGQRVASLDHGDVISAVEIADDGQLAVSADRSGRVKVWNPVDGSLKYELVHLPGRLRVAMLPERRLMAYVKSIEETETTELVVWRLGDASAQELVRLSANVAIAKYDPRSTRLVVADVAGTVSFWDSTSGKRFEEQLAHTSMLSAIYSGALDDEWLTVQYDGTLTNWSMRDGRRDVARHPVTILATATDPSRRFLAVAGNDGVVLVYWRHSLQAVGTGLATDEAVVEVDFHPDGRRLLTAGNTGVVRVWDLAGMAPDVPLLIHNDEVNYARFSPDGERVISCSDEQTGAIWNTATGVRLGALQGHTGSVFDCAFNQDGSTAVTAGRDGDVRVWDAARGLLIGGPLSHERAVVRIQFSPSDPTLLVAATADGALTGWNVSAMRQVFQTEPTGANIVDIAFSPDGKDVVVAGVDGNAFVVDVSAGKVISPPLLHSDAVTRCGFSPDGATIWTCSSDGQVRFWKRGDGFQQTRAISFSDWPTAVAFGVNRMLIANYDGSLTTWEGELPSWQFQRRKHYFKYCEVNANDRIATVCGGTSLSKGRLGTGAAFLLDAESGLPVAPALHHFNSVERAYFDTTGRRLLTSSHDGTARIWLLVDDDRAAEAIRRHTQLLSGKRIGEALQIEYVAAHELVELFGVARAETPDQFHCDDQQVSRWDQYVDWVALSSSK